MLVKENKKLKKIKMKGEHTPLLFIFILGFLHRKRKLILHDGNGLISPYLVRKEKEFFDYQAKLFESAVRRLEPMKQEKILVLENIGEAQYLLEKLQQDENAGEENGISQKRAEKVKKRKIEDLQKRKAGLFGKLSEIEDEILVFDTEIRETILSCKRKLEAKLSVYFEGGGFVKDAGHDLPEDGLVLEAYEIYKRTIAIYKTVATEGVEDNV